MGLRHSAATILLNQVGRDLREIQADHRNLRSILTKFCKAGIGGGGCRPVKHKLLNRRRLRLSRHVPSPWQTFAHGRGAGGQRACAGDPSADRR